MPIIEAFVSDLDDTLLNEQHELSPRNQQTLARILRQGVKVILASGRSAASMRVTVDQVGTPFPYIAYNGAQIVDAKTHQVLAAEEIPVELAREVLRWYEAEGVYAQYYHGDDWFCVEANDISDAYGKAVGVTGTPAGRKLSEAISAPTPKILAIDTPERAQALIRAGQERFGDRLMITTSKPHFVEITMPGATKGKAVAKLAEMIGLSPETTICAGDSLNDLSMLEWSHLPVSVANGREEIRRAAKYVAGDGRRDGIAILLDELIPPTGGDAQ